MDQSNHRTEFLRIGVSLDSAERATRDWRLATDIN